MAGEVTLDLVAKKSGVSRATASRALNGKAGVAGDVRDRVVMVAEALNYRPNRAAQNLAGGRASVVGLVLRSEALVEDLYAASLVQAMAKASDRYDEGLMLMMSNKEPSRAVSNLLRDGLIDGVVVSAVATGERWVEELLDAKVTTVMLGCHPTRTDVNVIDAENLESSAAVVGHMLDTGCRRVGAITGRAGRVDAMRRVEGYRLAHQRRGLAVDDDLIVAGDFTRLTGYRVAPTLFDLGVDGIFAANDETAYGVAQAAVEHGLTIPDDLSLAGFDGIATSELNLPELTTVLQPFDEIAGLALSSLIGLLDGASIPLEQLVEPTLRFGATTHSP